MPKKSFMPRSDAQRVTWLSNFVAKLLDPAKAYATKYNVAAATITQLANGLTWLQWALQNMMTAQVGSRSLTRFKNATIEGTVMPTIPAAAVYSTLPTVPYEPGVMLLAGSVGQQIKDSTIYAIPDGTDMGLEGAEIVPADPATKAPVLQTRPGNGGMTEVMWEKEEFDAIKLMVDRADGKGKVFLAMDTEPNYIDTVMPAPGTTAIYTYTAIYILNDAEFGQWSQEVQATVKG